MPAPARIRNWVFVAVYRRGIMMPEFIRILRSVGRHAVEADLFPVNPWVVYGPYLSEGEIGDSEERLSLNLLSRSSRIWLYEPPGGEMDRATFSVLTRNEGSFLRSGKRTKMQRIPVALYNPLGENVTTTPLNRERVSEIVGCHLYTGLFK